MDALPATVGRPGRGDGSLEPLVAVGEEDAGVVRWLLVVEVPSADDDVVVVLEDALPVLGCEFVVVLLWELLVLVPEVSEDVDSELPGAAGEDVLELCWEEPLVEGVCCVTIVVVDAGADPPLVVVEVELSAGEEFPPGPDGTTGSLPASEVDMTRSEWFISSSSPNTTRRI